MSTEKAFEGVGQTWRADFGSDGPWGLFVNDITFDSDTDLSFVVAEGGFAGSTDSMPYTHHEIRDGVHILQWHEPKSGAYVTQISDWTNGTVVASIVAGDQFVRMLGTFTRLS